MYTKLTVMKKTMLCLAAILLNIFLLQAQQDNTIVKKNPPPAKHKNMVKLNLFALPLRNISVQYEHQISRKSTIGFSLRVMPQGDLPFLNSFRNAISDTTTQNQLNNIKVGNFALMPEIRFYLSRKGAYRGFYIAPFFSYAHYSVSLPYSYTDNGVDKTIPISGNVNTMTGGIMFGAQWKLGKSIYLDWRIFGPHYGSSKGSISGQQSLSSSEQSSLQSSLNNLNIPLVKTSSTVDANGATLNFSGPWAGIRAGLCIGFRF